VACLFRDTHILIFWRVVLDKGIGLEPQILKHHFENKYKTRCTLFPTSLAWYAQIQSFTQYEMII
jgi:hypothetical protein